MNQTENMEVVLFAFIATFTLFLALHAVAYCIEGEEIRADAAVAVSALASGAWAVAAHAPELYLAIVAALS